jgi:phosphoribosylformylglycinamidine synthase
VAATNNLNFGNPERPEIMAQLVEAIEGITEACLHFETPITGGNVSLYNETLGEAIWPTPVMGIVGLMKTEAPVTIPFKEEGRTVMLLGGLGSPDATRFGGTQYAKVVLNTMWGLPPALDMDYEKRVHTAIRAVVQQGLAESTHDLGDGGLAVALGRSVLNRNRRVNLFEYATATRIGSLPRRTVSRPAFHCFTGRRGKDRTRKQC